MFKTGDLPVKQPWSATQKLREGSIIVQNRLQLADDVFEGSHLGSVGEYQCVLSFSL